MTLEGKDKGVLYIADDDNTYDLELFIEVFVILLDLFQLKMNAQKEASSDDQKKITKFDFVRWPNKEDWKLK